jgi:hypothetical protein
MGKRAHFDQPERIMLIPKFMFPIVREYHILTACFRPDTRAVPDYSWKFDSHQFPDTFSAIHQGNTVG